MTSRVRLDLTAALRTFAERRVEELAELEIDGYVLKAGSPSCAISRPLDTAGDSTPGLFAEALMRKLPDLPVADEQQLAHAEARRRFVDRVFARYRAAKVAG